MPLVFEIRHTADLLQFVVWSLALIACVKTVFHSFWAAEGQYRLLQLFQTREGKMQRLNWEVRNGVVYDPDVVRGHPHAAKQSLSELEVEQRRSTLRQMMRYSILDRMIRYFLECFACQAFWLSIVMVLCVRGWTGFGDVVLTAFAYCGAAMAISTWLQRFTPHTEPRPANGPRKAGCKNCGS